MLIFSGLALPLMSPITKYTGMINSAIPYNYPGKEWFLSFHSRLWLSFIESCWDFYILLQPRFNQILNLLFLSLKMQSLFEMMETCLMFPPIHVPRKETIWSGSKNYNFIVTINTCAVPLDRMCPHICSVCPRIKIVYLILLLCHIVVSYFSNMWNGCVFYYIMTLIAWIEQSSSQEPLFCKCFVIWT